MPCISIHYHFIVEHEGGIKTYVRGLLVLELLTNVTSNMLVLTLTYKQMTK